MLLSRLVCWSAILSEARELTSQGFVSITPPSCIWPFFASHLSKFLEFHLQRKVFWVLLHLEDGKRCPVPSAHPDVGRGGSVGGRFLFEGTSNFLSPSTVQYLAKYWCIMHFSSFLWKPGGRMVCRWLLRRGRKWCYPSLLPCSPSLSPSEHLAPLVPQAVKKENSGNFSFVKFVGMEPNPLGKQFTVSWFCCIKNHCDLIPRVVCLLLVA